jgi:hypothetical protein
VIRVALLALLAVAVWSYFPKARVYTRNLASPVLTPVFRWQTRQELTQIAHELQVHERENLGRIPDGRRFRTWLEQSFTGDAILDAWGTPYSLEVQRDSFTIVSWGPDGLPDTSDDMQVGRRRASPAR